MQYTKRTKLLSTQYLFLSSICIHVSIGVSHVYAVRCGILLIVSNIFTILKCSNLSNLKFAGKNNDLGILWLAKSSILIAFSCLCTWKCFLYDTACNNYRLSKHMDNVRNLTPTERLL